MTDPSFDRQYGILSERMMEIADILSASSLLQWDQETYMPEKSVYFRSRQVATLNGLAHEKFLSSEVFDLIESLLEKAEPDSQKARLLSRLKKDYLRKSKLSRTFVEKLSKQISVSFEKWEKARNSGKFEEFSASLSNLIELKREECILVDASRKPYDVLLEDYEPGMTQEILDKIFNQLIPPLTALAQQIQNSNDRPNRKILQGYFDEQSQWEIGLQFLAQLGLDFKRGRQDKSSHPFTISLSPDDVRITTRISTSDIQEMLWSCFHEAGHALYEQGLDASGYGLPIGEAASLGIHESQSRLWENQVARSLPYWQTNYQAMQMKFPQQFGSVPLNEFYRAINQVEPGLIRTQADELHYHFHIYIRYQLERDLIEGKLKTEDLRDAWNEMYLKYLGKKPGNDLEGVLQDVHWAHGSFGYFPTYSLGSLYAAQFFNQAMQEVHPTNGIDVAQLLSWLNQHIFSKGRLFTSEEICHQCTGKGLDPGVFIQYLQTKYQSVYKIAQT